MRKILMPVMVVLLAAMIMPQPALARAGGGSSSGSRGSHTYQSSPYGGSTLNRSATARPEPSRSAYPAQPAYMPPAAGRPSFMSGLAGGFLGAGLFHMFFGGSGGGYGGVGGSGMGFFEMLLLCWAGWYMYKKFVGGNTGGTFFSSRGISAMTEAPMANDYPLQSSLMQSPVPQNPVPQSPALGEPVQITDDDKHAFEQLFVNIQQAWSNGDLSKMRMYLTPEMVQYFSEELSVNASKGLANKVEQVNLHQADIAESWHEYGIDYATAKLQWSSLDYMTRLDRKPGDSDYVASGDVKSPAPAQEFWTFMRTGGGHWLLSAIQQLG